MRTRDYFSYLLNPLDLLRTQKVLQVNPTAVATRQEPDAIKLFVYDFNALGFLVFGHFMAKVGQMSAKGGQKSAFGWDFAKFSQFSFAAAVERQFA